MHETADIRNLAVVGHSGAGKTLLVEALLSAGGAIEAMGSGVSNSTVCDFEPQEKRYQHSLYAAVASLQYKKKQINIIDTPGYPDFLGQSLSVLSAVDALIVVIDAQDGIQLATSKMMEIAEAQGLQCMLLVNRIDLEEINLAVLMEQMTAAFGDRCLPLNLPSQGAAEVVDCFLKPSQSATDFSTVAESHTRIIDRVVEMDDELMEWYLEEGGELTFDMLRDALGKALRQWHLVPVCFTSAQAGVGIAELLDLIVQILPSPGTSNRDNLIYRQANDEPLVGEASVAFSNDPHASAIAHVFKVTVDAFIGRTGVLRIHQGMLTKDSTLHVSGSRKPFKVNHLFRLQGGERIEIEQAIAGDICAIARMDKLEYNAVLHEAADDASLKVKAIPLPQPMYSRAIQALSSGDEQKLSDAMHKLSAEDQSFTIQHNTVLNETVLKSQGELHTRVLLERLKERYNVNVETYPPRIEYHETIQVATEGHYRHKKQSGGAGQFGEVFLFIEPTERGKGFDFVDKVVGGSIPGQFIPAVEKGVRQVLAEGAIAGYPLQDVRVTVYDGKYHPVDSKEVAFVTAGKRAFLDAISRAQPIILEPVMDIQIIAPEQHMGDIVAGLSSKRGRISSTGGEADNTVSIIAQVPLNEIAAYQIELKSITGGAGSYTAELSHYDAVPAQVQQQIVAEYTPAATDD